MNQQFFLWADSLMILQKTPLMRRGSQQVLHS